MSMQDQSLTPTRSVCAKHNYDYTGSWCGQCVEVALAKLKRENPNAWKGVMAAAMLADEEVEV